jgi:hypothetical protein
MGRIRHCVAIRPLCCSDPQDQLRERLGMLPLFCGIVISRIS